MLLFHLILPMTVIKLGLYITCQSLAYKHWTNFFRFCSKRQWFLFVWTVHYLKAAVPTVLAPWVGFTEDDFSVGEGRRFQDDSKHITFGGGLVSKSCPTLETPWTIAHQAPLCPRDFPGKNTGVGCHFLLQGIFPTQRWFSYTLFLLLLHQCHLRSSGIRSRRLGSWP